MHRAGGSLRRKKLVSLFRLVDFEVAGGPAEFKDGGHTVDKSHQPLHSNTSLKFSQYPLFFFTSHMKISWDLKSIKGKTKTPLEVTRRFTFDPPP